MPSATELIEHDAFLGIKIGDILAWLTVGGLICGFFWRTMIKPSTDWHKSTAVKLEATAARLERMEKELKGVDGVGVSESMTRLKTIVESNSVVVTMLQDRIQDQDERLDQLFHILAVMKKEKQP